MLLLGILLMLAGVAVARLGTSSAKKRPTSASDLPIFVGAAVIAGGAMMTLVSLAVLLIGT
jgi:hypothetical protein